MIETVVQNMQITHPYGGFEPELLALASAGHTVRLGGYLPALRAASATAPYAYLVAGGVQTFLKFLSWLSAALLPHLLQKIRPLYVCKACV